MELYEEILLSKWRRNEDFNEAIDQIVGNECYLAFQQIRDILSDDSFSDEACFMAIERIVCLFEDLGSSCGSRHDFG